MKDFDWHGGYPATSRLGNPDTAAEGDSKQLRETMHDTTEGTCKTLAEAVQKSTEQLGSWQNKSKIYRELVEDFCDCFATAEEDLTEEEISKAFIEALEAQRDYYLKREKFYSNLRATIKFNLNESKI